MKKIDLYDPRLNGDLAIRVDESKESVWKWRGYIGIFLSRSQDLRRDESSRERDLRAARQMKVKINKAINAVPTLYTRHYGDKFIGL